MKPILSLSLFFILIFLTPLTNCNKNTHCEVLLKDMGRYNVYEKPTTQSRIIYIINNDTILENYYTIVIHKIRHNWGLITAYSPKKSIDKQGWIPLEKLGILISGTPVLYKKPDKQSEKVEIIEYDYGYLNVHNCLNRWLLVSYSTGSINYRGWLAPENQCANPYTTCN
jgi:hypothetical protein